MRRIALFAALTAGLVAAIAFGQSVVQDGRLFNSTNSTGSRSTVFQPMLMGGVVRADTTSKALTMDADGNLKMVNAAPIQSQFRDGSVAVINSAIAALSADSSAVISMGAYRLYGLAIRMTVNPSLTARLAVQIRFHLNAQSDSSSIFPFGGMAFTGAAVDTSGYGTTVSPTTTLVGRSEFLVNLTSDGLAASSFGNPPNIYIDLRDRVGLPIWAPYISVRVRVLSVTTALAAGVPIKVYLTGTPL
jgi:hypothetical protein